MRKLSRFGMILLLCCPALALAQQPASSGDAVNQIIGMLFNIPSEMVQGSPFSAAGTRLLSLLLTILVSWRMIKLMLEGSGITQLISELVNIILLWGIASFFLEGTVATKIAESFDALAGMAAGATGGTAGDSAQTMLANNLSQMMKAAYQLYEGAPPDKQPTWYAQAWSTLTGGQFWATVANVLFRFFTAILVIICAFLYCINVVFSQIMVNIALVLAPIFVPWIMWESSSFLFHGWLKFLITAGMQKVVGALMFGITTNFIGKVATMAASAEASASMNFYYYSACFLLTAIMAYMMMQVSSIANGLISGSSNTGFRPPAVLTPGGGMGRGGGATNISKPAGAGVQKAAGAAWNKLTGGGKGPSAPPKGSTPPALPTSSAPAASSGPKPTAPPSLPPSSGRP